jgi:DNA-binding NtrC family response regulator
MLKTLIIDDDKLIRWSLKEIFIQEGHQVDSVATADEALKKAEQDSYCLICADLEIQDEDGIELLKKLQKMQPEARLIILSALSQNQIEARLSNLSIFSIMDKPFNSDQIRKIARNILESPDR